MSDIDPLTGQIDQLQLSLSQPTSASTAGAAASVEVGVDGSLRINLTDVGRRLDADSLVAEIVRLHADALAESRAAIAAAIAQIENDPRLRALQERGTDALNQPRPQQQAPVAPTPPGRSGAENWSQTRRSPEPIASTRPRTQNRSAQPPAAPPRAPAAPPRAASPSWPQPPAATPSAEPVRSREPTQEEEEEMDRYYRRESWLEP